MSERKNRAQGVGAQALARENITQDNMAESLQKIYDLLGAAKLGKASENSVYVCGVLLKNVDSELGDIKERLRILESKQGDAGNG
jgi:hypothetical protein